MTNSPVYYALAQAQFNPVAAMAKYVDEIQDILRRDGYTLFEPQEITQLQFVGVAGQASTNPAIVATTTAIESSAVSKPLREASNGLTLRIFSYVVLYTIGSS